MSPRIPLFDLKRQYRSIAPELRRAVLKALDSGLYILGPEGYLFEQDFARAVGAREAVGVSSGTAALRIALRSLGVGPGDEVVVPALTFAASATAVIEAGGRPAIADVDPATLTLDPESAERALTRRTRAILAVHLYGQPADMTRLRALARRRGLKLVEDCAQAHLTLYRGRPAGTLGDAAAFSFYPSKNLGAAGDAGAVTTGSARVARVCRELRHAGRPAGQAYRHARMGYNSRLDELQAAVLRVKLRRLAGWTRRRRALASLYVRELAGLPLGLPDPGADGTRHSFHLFVIRSARRDALAKHLANRGIGCGVYYPIPIHLQPAFKDLGRRAGDFPVAERACKTVLALPLYPELRDVEALRVCRAVGSFFK